MSKMKLLGTLPKTSVWQHNAKYYSRGRKVFMSDELRQRVFSSCYALPPRFAGNVRHLCSVYNIGVLYLSRDSRALGFAIHRQTIRRMETIVGFTLTIMYCCYVMNYFNFRFGCTVSVGEMLSFDLSQYDRYSKKRLNPKDIMPTKGYRDRKTKKAILPGSFSDGVEGL